jgi:DNA invertase Pin-like site-specific DNA recombinase
MRKPDRPKSGVIFRCAIYTRKSSDDGLEQEFNSLDAQREACEAYVTSQRHAGWLMLPNVRPEASRAAMAPRPCDFSPTKAGKVQDCRFSRPPYPVARQFARSSVLNCRRRLVRLVTRQFHHDLDGTSRQHHMLLSFAQFRREIAGERIRDKIAASKAKGMWMGGNVPLGYDVRERKLVVREAEASIVRMIFQRYAELGSVALLKAELEWAGIVSKRREGADGELSGGKRFSRGALYLMLQNWLYRGNVAHKEKIYLGQHEAIIEPELWQAVQDRLAAGRRERSMAVGTEPSLLSGLIIDSDSARLSPTHAVKKGKRYRYYVSTALITRTRSEHPKGRRIPAGDIEGLVLDRLRALFASGAEVGDAVAPLGLDATAQRAVLDRSAKLAERWTKLASLELRERVRSLVQQIQIGEAQILVWLNRTAIVSSVMPDAPPKPTDSVEPFVLSITASLRRAGKGVRLVIGNGAAKAIDDGLASLIARAIATRNMFLAGRDDSIDALASRLGVRRDYLAVLVRLSYLSPEIVRAILIGQQPIELTPTRLVMLSRTLPHDWQEQRRLLGFAPA